MNYTRKQARFGTERHRLTDDLLDTVTNKLKAEEAPIREVMLKDCGTVVSDGWDDVEKNHLINFLVGTSMRGGARPFVDTRRGLALSCTL